MNIRTISVISSSALLIAISGERFDNTKFIFSNIMNERCIDIKTYQQAMDYGDEVIAANKDWWSDYYESYNDMKSSDSNIKRDIDWDWKFNIPGHSSIYHYTVTIYKKDKDDKNVRRGGVSMLMDSCGRLHEGTYTFSG